VRLRGEPELIEKSFVTRALGHRGDRAQIVYGPFVGQTRTKPPKAFFALVASWPKIAESFNLSCSKL